MLLLLQCVLPDQSVRVCSQLRRCFRPILQQAPSLPFELGRPLQRQPHRWGRLERVSSRLGKLAALCDDNLRRVRPTTSPAGWRTVRLGLPARTSSQFNASLAESNGFRQCLTEWEASESGMERLLGHPSAIAAAFGGFWRR